MDQREIEAGYKSVGCARLVSLDGLGEMAEAREHTFHGAVLPVAIDFAHRTIAALDSYTIPKYISMNRSAVLIVLEIKVAFILPFEVNLA